MIKQKNQANKKNPRRRKKPEEVVIKSEISEASGETEASDTAVSKVEPIGSVVHPVALTDDTPIDEREEAPGLPMEEDEPEEDNEESDDEESDDDDDADDKDDDEEAEEDSIEYEEDEKEGSMSLMRHLEELRSRIIKSLLAVAVGSGIAYFYIEEIMDFVTMPSGKLYYMQPAEAFLTSIKVALFTGFLLALPVVFYQIWRFVLPALTVREKTMIALLVPASVILFFVGIAFSFFLVLPIAIKFFVGFSTENLQPMFSISQYFSFVTSFVLPFGAVFELPLVILVMAKLGFINSEFLRKKQRLVLFLTFIIGAIVTPPDVFSQAMIAIPLFMLYEVSYLIVRFVLQK